MRVSNEWKDYECLDAGGKEKLEKWGSVILRRPEPTAIWAKNEKINWDKVDGTYYRYKDGGGHWEFSHDLEDYWVISYKDLKFKVSPTNFKHTGLFPEQAVNWDFMMQKIKEAKRDIKVLNLFAYTGGATIACSKAGAREVVHVDSSKGMILWAKENAKLNNLENNHIRYLVDDCLKFVEKEIRRGHKYDAIVMDPPSYGRGPNKELWKLEDSLDILIEKCVNLLSDEPLFFLINCYTTGLSKEALYNILTQKMQKYSGVVDAGEVGLIIKSNNLKLPCGIYGRWQND